MWLCRSLYTELCPAPGEITSLKTRTFRKTCKPTRTDAQAPTSTYGGAGTLEGGASGEAIGLKREREVQGHNSEWSRGPAGSTQARSLALYGRRFNQAAQQPFFFF